MAKSFHHNQALRADKAKPLQGDQSFPLWHGAYRGLWNVASFSSRTRDAVFNAQVALDPVVLRNVQTY